MSATILHPAWCDILGRCSVTRPQSGTHASIPRLVYGGVLTVAVSLEQAARPGSPVLVDLEFRDGDNDEQAPSFSVPTEQSRALVFELAATTASAGAR